MDIGSPLLCLIAEDEPLIGADLEESVVLAGYRPLWFTSSRKALEGLSDLQVDVAVIDVGLRDDFCIDLVRALRRIGVPFIIHSGLPPEPRPLDLRNVPWLAKPASRAEVAAAIRAVLVRP